MTYTLRPYQQEAVDATLAHFRKTDEPAVIVLPTGAGKSLVIAELARLAKRKILVLAHVKELVEQNYEKFITLTADNSIDAGIFSAGLKRKESHHQVTFASVQSVAPNLDAFDESHSLLIVDECHRMSMNEDSQYAQVITALKQHNPQLKVLGLTATPYRMGMGWVYQNHYRGFIRTPDPRPFTACIYELPLRYMIKAKFLTPPRLIDAPIAQYDFSALPTNSFGECAEKDMNQLLVKHPRVTQSICEQIIEHSEHRQGVMIFATTLAHAREITGYLPNDQTALITGDTPYDERDKLINAFKRKELKYLVNLSVLTTGFDAPHVDFIAILRPTQSVSLYQQIVGRGLRLAPNKKDCLVIDYAGNGFDLYHPEVGSKKPNEDSEAVQVLCPECGFGNIFWGIKDEEGVIIEHYGRRCQGLIIPDDEAIFDTNSLADSNNNNTDPSCVDLSNIDSIQNRDNGIISTYYKNNEKLIQCTFRYRFKNCPHCNEENDIAARSCQHCHKAIIDPDDQLKTALSLREAKVIRCAGMSLSNTQTKPSQLVVSYHDEHGDELKEYFDFNLPKQQLLFNHLFCRRLQTAYSNAPSEFTKACDVLPWESKLQAPDFVIARKPNKRAKFWNIQDRLFDYEGNYRKANQL